MKSLTKSARIERIASGEARNLLQRDYKKYGKVVTGLYIGGPLPTFSLARAAYFFARHIDDILDEQDVSDDSGLGQQYKLPRDLSSLLVSRHHIAQLGAYSLNELNQRKHAGDNPSDDMQRLLNAMYFDYHRAKEGRTLTIAELDQYFNDTMRATNLMLIGVRSRYRQDADFPDFASAIGATYSARDMAIDWKRGICNIPSEVLSSDFPSQPLALELQVVLDAPIVHEWYLEQLSNAKNTFGDVLQRTPSIADYTFGRGPKASRDIGGLIVNAFASGGLRVAEEHLRSFSVSSS